MRLTDRPPRTGTPHEMPAGTGKGCRRTSYPKARRRRAVQMTARRKAALVACRGPIAPAKCWTVRNAVAVRRWAGRGRPDGVTGEEDVGDGDPDDGRSDDGLAARLGVTASSERSSEPALHAVSSRSIAHHAAGRRTF